MRVLPLAAVFGAALFSVAAGQAQAGPLAIGHDVAAAPAPIVRVELSCNPSRCIDPQTGAYTQSGCNRHGCYPISGVVGYINRGYGSSFPPEGRHWRHHHRDWDDWR